VNLLTRCCQMLPKGPRATFDNWGCRIALKILMITALNSGRWCIFKVDTVCYLWACVCGIRFMLYVFWTVSYCIVHYPPVKSVPQMTDNVSSGSLNFYELARWRLTHLSTNVCMRLPSLCISLCSVVAVSRVLLWARICIALSDYWFTIFEK